MNKNTYNGNINLRIVDTAKMASATCFLSVFCPSLRVSFLIYVSLGGAGEGTEQ